MTARRLAVDAAAVRVGGGVSRVKELTSAFAALAPDVEYTVAVAREIATLLTAKPPHIRFVTVPKRLAPAPLRMGWEHLRLPGLFNQARPDWILSPVNVLPLGPAPGRTPPRALILSNIAPLMPELWPELGIRQATRLRVVCELTYRSLEAADEIFLLSREARRLLGERISGKSVTSLPMSPPPPSTLASADAAELPLAARRGPYFVCVGDISRYRGVDDAIHAVLELEREGLDVDLLVCGATLQGGYMAELRRLADRSPSGRIKFLGSLPQPIVLRLMRQSIATVVCSRVENVSRIPIEAMAIGSPILAADLPAQWESCGQAARYYPHGDTHALAAAMSELAEDPSAREVLVAAGRRQISDRDWLSATRALLTKLGFIDSPARP